MSDEDMQRRRRGLFVPFLFPQEVLIMKKQKSGTVHGTVGPMTCVTFTQ